MPSERICVRLRNQRNLRQLPLNRMTEMPECQKLDADLADFAGQRRLTPRAKPVVLRNEPRFKNERPRDALASRDSM